MNLSYSIGKLLYPDFIWRVETEEKAVYLTFDDGPHPEITPWVLDQLKQYGFTASFFVVGDNVLRSPEVVRRIKEEGHSLGNHTQSHMKGWEVSSEHYLQDIQACNAILPTDLFRPPYGRINRQAIPELNEYRIVMWDNLSRDYRPNLNVKRSLMQLCRNTIPGSIAVFHDSIKAEHNLKVLLPQYLDFLKAEGYTSKAL